MGTLRLIVIYIFISFLLLAVLIFSCLEVTKCLWKGLVQTKLDTNFITVPLTKRLMCFNNSRRKLVRVGWLGTMQYNLWRWTANYKTDLYQPPSRIWWETVRAMERLRNHAHVGKNHAPVNIEWMNIRTNERTNERTKERTNERTQERTNERTNNRKNERMNEKFISVSEPYSLRKSHTNLGTQNNKIRKSRINKKIT